MKTITILAIPNYNKFPEEGAAGVSSVKSSLGLGSSGTPSRSKGDPVKLFLSKLAILYPAKATLYLQAS